MKSADISGFGDVVVVGHIVPVFKTSLKPQVNTENSVKHKTYILCGTRSSKICQKILKILNFTQQWPDIHLQGHCTATVLSEF